MRASGLPEPSASGGPQPVAKLPGLRSRPAAPAPGDAARRRAAWRPRGCPPWPCEAPRLGADRSPPISRASRPPGDPGQRRSARKPITFRSDRPLGGMGCVRRRSVHRACPGPLVLEAFAGPHPSQTKRIRFVRSRSVYASSANTLGFDLNPSIGLHAVLFIIKRPNTEWNCCIKLYRL
jgi:hypothetical protein